jgi:serine protease Do
MSILHRIWGAGLWPLGAVAFGLAAPLAAPAAATDADLNRAINRVFPALVRIFVVSDDAGGGRMEKFSSAGSGAVISEEGYIITNHHVAGRARHLVCRMADGEEIEAKLIGTDALSDIAIIQLDLSRRKKKGALAVAKFGDSARVRIGETVLAMGSPMAVSQSVTKGIVSNTALMIPTIMSGAGFRLDGESVGSLVRWIGHDAVIYGGNSGGPLVNLEGEIVGINEVGLGSLGGAIPANLARAVAYEIIKKGFVERSYIGLEAQPRPRDLSADHGVLISGVIPGSPAAQAGLRAGDVVTDFNGTAVDARIQEDLPLFNALVLSSPIGKQVIIKALRDGQPQTFQLATQARGKAINRDIQLKDWGITARDFTMLAAIERKRPNTDGVEVTTLDVGAAAASAMPPLEPGDIIVAVDNKPVRSIADLRQATKELLKGTKEPRRVLVAFDRGVSRYLTVAKLNQQDTAPEETARKPGLQMILQPVGPELAQALRLLGNTGVRVAFVFPNRAPDKAGIQPGDILLRFDGDPIRCVRADDVSQLLSRVRKYKVGAEVEFELRRGADTKKVTMKLEEDGPAADELKKFKDKNLELTVREMTEMERVTQKIPDDVRGLRVDEVTVSGWASLGHVMVGDILLAIDGQPTPDVPTAEKLLKAAAEKKPRQILFFLRRGVHTFFAELEPNWDSIAGEQAAGATKPTGN